MIPRKGTPMAPSNPESLAAALGYYLCPYGADPAYADGRPVIWFDATQPRHVQLAAISARVQALTAAERDACALSAAALVRPRRLSQPPPPLPPVR